MGWPSNIQESDGWNKTSIVDESMNDEFREIFGF